ncbi:RNA polymerase sigma factor [Mucilaginibacter sp. L3T2-6]|uniref:RNA polymerase sigma factor n=1 Tax=Mucilaginibacter sp. L3T2-6 TaxID=3062491 RepID=UPI002676595C|nr:sigma-70 family RNA polymerase sigma factor [Mucilaginibacter sp. L3T2-6]MDO3643970.1 sigma-70 family RNA polymerase sigma factor [Mucilaginibacter sp. L3T2-6]MDV6216307.1 sigma-70 family RNA polymerase sigma factor [Mucilaginibacter sp. L3T2-6]
MKGTIYHTDRELIAAILNGERHAFAAFVRLTENLVVKMVFQMTGGSADRQDLVQEIYLKAFRNLASFRHGSKLSTWIGQIAYYDCLHYIKKKKLTYLEDIPEESAMDVEPSGEVALFKSDLSAILSEAVARLPPLYQTLVTLFHEEELSYSEIGEITHLPEGTIKNYLFRARKILRNDLLKKYDREDL